MNKAHGRIEPDRGGGTPKISTAHQIAPRRGLWPRTLLRTEHRFELRHDADHVRQVLALLLQPLVHTARLLEPAGQFVDLGQPLVQQKLQAFGVERLEPQGAVHSEQLQLQQLALSPQFGFGD